MPAPSQNHLTVCSYKIEDELKVRFAEAMKAEGTTVSERIRLGIKQYLQELEERDDGHPQFTLELVVNTQKAETPGSKS